MSHPEFRTIPVGLNGDYCVQRSMNGEVQYLASHLDPEKIGRYSLDLAESTCRVFRYDPTHSRAVQNERWLPWPTDHLPYGKPASVFGYRPSC